MTCHICHCNWDNGYLCTNALFQEVSGVWDGKEKEGG